MAKNRLIKKEIIKFIIFLELLIISFLLLFLFLPSENKDFKCIDCNVLIITMDSLRADHVGAYGYQRDTTPNIDLLARKGILFKDYIANAPLTFFSLPSMMTSQYPESTNVFFNITSTYINVFYLNKGFITLADKFNEKNYTTAAFTLNPFTRVTNVDKGFNNKYNSIVPTTDEDDKMNVNLINHLKEYSKKKEKFFVWVHFYSPHSEYMPPYPFNNTFYNDSFYNRRGIIKPDYTKAQLPFFIRNDSLIDADYYVSQYDGEIRFIDREIGKIIFTLEKEGVINNTLIVVSSDHGESLTEHNRYFDHGSLYDAELRVPLLIFNPRSDIVNNEIKGQVQGVDLYPSILEITNIINYPKEQEGKSFYNLIIGKNYIERIARLYSEENQAGIRTHSWKFISTEKGYELYCLIFDKGEKHNLLAWYNYLTIKNK